MELNSYPIVLTAGGAVQDGPNKIFGLTLVAGSDTATLSIHDDTEYGAPVKWKLSAIAGTSSSMIFDNPLDIQKGIFVDITGTSAEAFAAVDSSTQVSAYNSHSNSPSSSPSHSASPSNSPSASPSSSSSVSNSPSLSPSHSASPSSSNSPSTSPSQSPSYSVSPSSSNSPSASPSASQSPSHSASPSASLSPSFP